MLCATEDASLHLMLCATGRKPVLSQLGSLVHVHCQAAPCSLEGQARAAWPWDTQHQACFVPCTLSQHLLYMLLKSM